MKNALLAATAAVVLAASFCRTANAAEQPYLDDRSDAVAVIRSLYNAISRHEYSRGWGYFGDIKPAEDFATFVKGYEGTERVDVETGGVSEEGAAGSVYFTVPVAIRAVGTDGSEKVFAGCYTLRKVNGEIQEPPFSPIHIEKGELKPATGNFEDAVPQSCGAGTPQPKKDSALEGARKAFAATYGDQCDADVPGNAGSGRPDAFVIRYKDSAASADEAERESRLFRFFCSLAAYNSDAVYYLSDDVGGLRQLQFAAPELDVRYENGDSDGTLESVTVTGFRTQDRAVNSEYDENARTITSWAKWRGVGDASATGTYLFRNGDFSLVQYDVDASYDGEVNPQTVVDYNIAP